MVFLLHFGWLAGLGGGWFGDGSRGERLGKGAGVHDEGVWNLMGMRCEEMGEGGSGGDVKARCLLGWGVLVLGGRLGDEGRWNESCIKQ